MFVFFPSDKKKMLEEGKRREWREKKVTDERGERRKGVVKKLERG